MSQGKDFGLMGMTFQQSLIKAIIEDRKYGETIINVLDARYFDNNSFKFIIQNIKELYSTYEKIPDYNTLSQKMVVEAGTSKANKVHSDTLEIIKNSELETEYVKDTALNFCRQQNIKKELKHVQSIIENGDFESYNKIEEIIQEALQVGVIEDNDFIDVFSDIEDALKDDFRQTIPTGITGIDNLLKGGLGRCELGVILAPTGTGKTTLLSKFANTAYNLGKHVLQIFFEDNPENIKRKHYTIWSGIAPDDQPNMASEVKRLVEEAQNKSKGKLNLIKYASDSKTVTDIKNMLRKYEAIHGKVDLLLIDYVDCIASEKAVGGDEWKGEGAIMRSLEAMTTEFDITIWTATQGSRCVSLDTVVNILGKGKTEIRNVNVGDKIETHKGWKDITYVFPIEKQPTYKITLKSGKTIKVSKKHKFPTSDGRMISIEEGLKTGDKLLSKK